MSIKIITDSCCDLPLDYVEALHEGLTVIGMPIQFENKTIIDDLGKTYEHKTFYDLLRRGVMPSTSQINAYRFEMAFKEAVASGYDVIYLGFSSGMSGTFNSAIIAKSLILEQFPHAKIEVVDTLCASVGQGALIIEALKRIRDDAYTFEKLIAWVEDKKYYFHHWFGVNDLNYLRNGGRISPTTALVGNVLHVKPTLTVDCHGVLKSHNNVRGRKKSLTLLEQKVKLHLDKTASNVILLGHGNCFDDALLLKEMLEQGQDHPTVMLTELSMTIASHVGPDMIAVAFLGDRRDS